MCLDSDSRVHPPAAPTIVSSRHDRIACPVIRDNERKGRHRASDPSDVSSRSVVRRKA